ncbi:MAG: hypothetical protein AMXMBFR81_31200 [Chthonomonas sp.]
MKALLALTLALGSALAAAQNRAALQELLLPPRPDLSFSRLDPTFGRAYDLWVLEVMDAKSTAKSAAEVYTDAALLAEVAPERTEAAFDRAVSALLAAPASTERDGCLALAYWRLGMPEDAEAAAANAVRSGSQTYWSPLLRGAKAMWEARAPFGAVLDDPNLSVRDRLNALSLAYQAARAMLESAVNECTAAARLAPENLLPVVERRRIVEALGSAQAGSGGEPTLVLGRTQLGQWLEDSRKIALLTKGPTAFRARAAAVYLGGLSRRYADPNDPSLVVPSARERFARAIAPEDRSALRVLAGDLLKSGDIDRVWRLVAMLRLADNDPTGAQAALESVASDARNRDAVWHEFFAGMLYAQGAFGAALEQLSPARPAAANTAALRLLRIASLAQSGRLREAADEAAAAAAAHSDSARLRLAHSILRAASGRQSDVDQAFEALERLVAIRPEDEGLRDDAAYNLAIVFALKGETARAESLLSSVRDRTLADRVEKVRAALKGWSGDGNGRPL